MGGAKSFTPKSPTGGGTVTAGGSTGLPGSSGAGSSTPTTGTKAQPPIKITSTKATPAKGLGTTAIPMPATTTATNGVNSKPISLVGKLPGGTKGAGRLGAKSGSQFISTETGAGNRTIGSSVGSRSTTVQASKGGKKK